MAKFTEILKELTDISIRTANHRDQLKLGDICIKICDQLKEGAEYRVLYQLCDVIYERKKKMIIERDGTYD